MTGFVPIPGETPIDDLSGLKVKGISTRAQLNEVEAENIRKATVKYLAAKPTRRMAGFDLPWALRLHLEMFGDVWAWAGTVRTTDTNIGVPPEQIQVRLKCLLDDLAFWEKQKLDLMEQTAMLHHRAVQIHPFKNGNGRWARLLTNIWRRVHDAALTEWPEKTIGTESDHRGEYLAAIQAADAGDLGPLLNLHKRFTPSR